MEEQLSPQDAKALLEQDRLARAQQCQAAVQAALAQYRCQLVARVVVTEDGRLAARVELAPQE